MLFLPMLYRVICVCIDLCTLCENNTKINDKKTPKAVAVELPPLFTVNLHSFSYFNDIRPTFSPVINVKHFYLLLL